MSLLQTQKLLAEQFKYPDDEVILHLDQKPKRVTFETKTEKPPIKGKKYLLQKKYIIGSWSQNSLKAIFILHGYFQHQ